MKSKKLYRVKPEHPPEINKPPKTWIKKPDSLLHLMYGFNSFRHCLETCHPEGVSEFLKQYFDTLVEQTDDDQLYCFEDEQRESLRSEGALDYFLALQQELSGNSKITILPNVLKLANYAKFNHAKIDYSLINSPVSSLLHSSCQAFYDYASEMFIFKDEACYKAFLERQILTPDLEHLIAEAEKEIDEYNEFDKPRVLLQEEAKILSSRIQLSRNAKKSAKNKIQECVNDSLKLNEIRKNLHTLDQRETPKRLRFKTLVFIIKNHVKMKMIGWTLSDHDRDLLEKLCKNSKPLLTAINSTLLERVENKKLSNLINQDKEYAGDDLSVEILLKKRHYETVQYLVFDDSRSPQEHARCICWLFNQKLCADSEKLSIANKYIAEIFSKLNKKQIHLFVDELRSTKPDLTISLSVFENYMDKPSTLTSEKLRLSTSPQDNDLPLTYHDSVDLQKRYKTPLKFFDEIKKTSDILHQFNEERGTKNEAVKKILRKEYVSSQYYSQNMIVIMVVYALLLHLVNYLLTNPKSVHDRKFNSGFMIVAMAMLVKLTDDYLFADFMETNMESGNDQYQTEFLQKLRDGIQRKEANPILNHYFGINIILLFLEPWKRDMVQKYHGDYLRSPDSHPATRTLLYFSVTLKESCRLTELKLNFGNIFDLICAVSEHHKLKSIHEIWTHPLNLAPIKARYSPDECHKKILEHVRHQRPFNETMIKLISEFIIAVTMTPSSNPLKYRDDLPTLAYFLKENLRKSVETSDLATLFWLTTDPFFLLNKSEQIRQSIVADLNAIAAKKVSNSSDQLPNMSYASSM